ncbi:MAG: cache domain-containing protein, partial [Clostridium sp.]
MGKLKQKIIKHRRNIKVICVNSFFFIVFTVILYIAINKHMSLMAVNDINTVGEAYKVASDNLIDDIRYESLQISTDADILSLDKKRIANRTDFIKYYSNNFKDIIVIDNNGVILSGYMKNVKEYLYQEYLKEAIRGNTTISQPINIQGKWFIDCVSPIYVDSKYSGIMSLRVSLSNLSDYFTNKNEDIEVFIVNSNGYYLSGGSMKLRKTGEDNIDINQLKTNLDYAPNKAYMNIDGNYVYGVYYELMEGE